METAGAKRRFFWVEPRHGGEDVSAHPSKQERIAPPFTAAPDHSGSDGYGKCNSARSAMLSAWPTTSNPPHPTNSVRRDGMFGDGSSRVDLRPMLRITSSLTSVRSTTEGSQAFPKSDRSRAYFRSGDGKLIAHVRETPSLACGPALDPRSARGGHRRGACGSSDNCSASQSDRHA